MDATLPDWLNEVVEAATLDHHDDIDAALEQAMAALWKHPGRDAVLKDLARVALRRQVQNCRTKMTATAKREARGFEPNRHNHWATDDVLETSRTIYDRWFIGNTVLGDLRGRDLPKIIKEEDAQAAGHLVNRDFCSWLLHTKKVGEEQTVRQAVPLVESLRKLRQLQKKHGQKVEEEAA
jgi:hypothetical protein